MSVFDKNHTHKYFAFETKSQFELVTFTQPQDEALEDLDLPTENLYLKTDWVVMACNCGDVLKKKLAEKP